MTKSRKRKRKNKSESKNNTRLAASAPPLLSTGSAALQLAQQAAQQANKIFPRNLTAQAAYQIAGNPVVTRPEDAVANCFPGLEIDVRNLDRRFFPGLVFNFVEPADQRVPGKRYGAVIAYNDFIEDPDLQIGELETERLYEELEKNCGINDIRTVAQNLYNDLNADPFAKGVWYLDW